MSQAPRPSTVKYDSSRKMMALQYQGKANVKIGEVPVPLVTDPTDVVVKVTATTICGSDLHLYHGLVPLMKKGDIMGHESIGVVEEVGPEVKRFKKGDRVVVSPVIACGQCGHCKRGEVSLCDSTNPKDFEDKLYGHHTSGLFGYSHTFGGYDGCQAEYVRVPIADLNLFPIPDNISDEEAVLVPDAGPTSYHGNVLADIQEGDKVVVLGCGPVGLLTQMWAKYRGASMVVAIDVNQQRLDFAKEKYGVITINSKNQDPLKAVQELIPGGPDKVIECVGFRFPDQLIHKIEMKLMLETDSPGLINLAIRMVRKKW